MHQRVIHKLLSVSNSLKLSVRDIASGKSVGFPVFRARGKSPGVLFCHGLGAAWDFPMPIVLQKYLSEYRQHSYTRFQYRFIGDKDHVWHVDTWVEDIMTMLDALHAEEGPQVLVACSAGGQAALRACIQRLDKVHSLLLISPGVGLDMSYMDRINPGSKKVLEAGKLSIHPALPGANSSKVSHKNLTDYCAKCPTVTYEKEIPITCPVSIVHGMQDFLVPFENAIKLARKLQSKNTELLLLKNQGHIMEPIPELLQMVDKALGFRDKNNAAAETSKEVSKKFRDTVAAGPNTLQ